MLNRLVNRRRSLNRCWFSNKSWGGRKAEKEEEEKRGEGEPPACFATIAYPLQSWKKDEKKNEFCRLFGPASASEETGGQRDQSLGIRQRKMKEFIVNKATTPRDNRTSLGGKFVRGKRAEPTNYWL